jgi:hypothetical protein
VINGAVGSIGDQEGAAAESGKPGPGKVVLTIA